jgi:hypothetical protein
MPSFGRLSAPIRPHGIEGNDVLHQGAGSPCPPLLFVVIAIRLGRFLVRYTFGSQSWPIKREATPDLPGIDQCLHAG